MLWSIGCFPVTFGFFVLFNQSIDRSICWSHLFCLTFPAFIKSSTWQGSASELSKSAYVIPSRSFTLISHDRDNVLHYACLLTQRTVCIVCTVLYVQCVQCALCVQCVQCALCVQCVQYVPCVQCVLYCTVRTVCVVCTVFPGPGRAPLPRLGVSSCLHCQQGSATFCQWTELTASDKKGLIANCFIGLHPARVHQEAVRRIANQGLSRDDVLDAVYFHQDIRMCWRSFFERIYGRLAPNARNLIAFYTQKRYEGLWFDLSINLGRSVDWLIDWLIDLRTIRYR